MSAFAWLRRSRRPSSPPELSSSAGRHSASRRPASSSDSSSPASAQRVLAACASGATRRLRRGLRPVLASALFALPLLAGLPTGAQAQVACSTANADGSYNVPFDWALKPSGLAAGSKFRLLFATSTTRHATATGIATYNTSVQTRAKAGHSAISDSCGNLFKVVGSTSAVDARVNTDTESTDTAALIYWLNGAKVADDYGDFYDGNWDSRAGRSETGGTVTSAAVVFTGTKSDGTKDPTHPLGATNVLSAGLGAGTPFGNTSRLATQTARFYVLSPIFTVGTKPVVTISAGTSPVTEGTAASFTLTVTPAPSAPLDVSVHISEGEADIINTANEGFKTVTVPAGAATHAVNVPTDNDTADERPGQVRAAMAPATDYTIGGIGIATVVVTDNDATLVSLVATSDVTFTEQTPTDTAAVTVRLPRRLYAGENLAVPIEFTARGVALLYETNPSFTLSVSGTGATGADLTEDPSFVRFTGHDTDIVQEATVTLTPTNNDDGDTVAGSATMILLDLFSGDWTASFTTVGGGGAPHGTDDEVRLVYADNDVMFDTLTLVPLGGPRIHLDIGTSPGLTGSGRDWTLEEGTDIVLRFSNLTEDLHSQDLVVNYAVAGAKHHVPNPTDKTVPGLGSRTVTIPANTRSVQVTLPTEATTDDETDAELSVMLLAATPPEGTTDTQGTYTTNFRPLNFTVTDGPDGHTNRIRPLVTVETWYANPSNDPDEPDKEDPRIEGDDLQFDVRLAPAAQVPFTVWLKVEETVGTGYGDCVAAGQERVRTVRFAPGVSWRTLRVPTVDDDVDEYDCEVTVSLASDASGTVPAPAQVFVNVDSGPGRGGYGIAVGSGFDLSGKAVATRLVRDNETGPKGSGSDDGIGPVTPGAGPAVTISADRTSVTEGGDVTFTVTADPAPARDLEVTVSADEEMGSGDDRTGGGHFGTVTVRAGQTTAMWTLTTISDQVALADGTVTGRIEAGDGYTVGKPFEVTVALLDDDGVVTQSVTDPVTPGVDPALVALVRGYAAETHQGQEHVDRWMRVLAAFGDDNGYTPMTAAEAQTHADKGWQRWVPVAAALEALEAPPLTLPAVSVSAGADVTEGGDAVFTVTASPAPAAALSVTVTVATAGEFGVTAGTQTVPIPTTGSATLTLATANDEVDEPDGSVSVTVAAGNGYTVGDPASGTVAIADDDPAPAVATVDPVLVAQVRGYAAETHQGQAHVDRWKRVLAAFGDDNGYTPMTAAEAQTHADKGWQRWVPVVAALAALEAPTEPQQVVTVSAGADVTEGGDATFTVTASPAPASPLSVTVTVAASGEFGVTAGTQTVPIPTTGSATLTLATSNDGADEPDGSVTLTVAAGDGYTVGDPASGTVAIADDDEPLPAIAVSAGDAVTEGGDATFTVTASPAPASPLAVSVTVATEGDYGVTAGTRTVSIPTAGSATLTLATSDDDADEPDGSVTLTVAAGNGYTVGDPASGSVSIADDDLPPPAVSIAAKAASVTEGGDAAFTLTADRAPDADLTVTLSVAETGGGDHVAAADEGPATATIAKGKTEAVFSVATVDDDVDEPDGSVTVTLKDGGGYTVPSPPGNAAAVTVSDDDAAAVGPVLSVDDATGQENGRLPVMPFTVRLSAPAQDAVRVYVSTRPSTPVSATPKVDYTPASSALTFRAGETEKQMWVMIHNDSHDEEPETFEVVLSDARGAAIGDGVAVGTIVNDDPMPAAWLARFGRTVAEQALDGIAGRMSADRTAGMQGSIAGQALSFDPAANDNPGSRGAGPGHAPDGAAVPGGTGALALADVAQAFGGQSGPGSFGHDAAGFANGTQSRTMTMQDALLGSSFSLTGEKDGSGGSMAFWGRAAQGGFDGREGTFSLDGTVTTGMLGADYARGKWLVGLALAQSAGEGDYRDTDVAPRPASQSCPAGAEGADAELCRNAVRAGDGKVEASLTAAIPYAALQVSERLKLWGAAGYGTGEVTLKTALGGSYKSDTTWSMAAAGLRGDLLAPPAPGSGSGAGSGSGPALAVTSDALWTRSSSEKTSDLAASESDATRLRLGLEGSYRMALEGGGHLTPKLEVGARHDGGDAETGFGVEIGGGIAWTDPALGLSLDVSGRTLIAHGNDDLKDRGYAAALAFDPDPATGRGPSLSLRQEFGGQARGGLDALFQPATLEDRTGSEATSRWAMEAAYGLPAFGGRWTGSPHVGLGLATAARDYSVGWRLTPAANANAPDLSFGLRATRRESDTQSAEHTVGVSITARW